MFHESNGNGGTWSRVSCIKGGSVNHYSTKTRQLPDLNYIHYSNNDLIWQQVSDFNDAIQKSELKTVVIWNKKNVLKIVFSIHLIWIGTVPDMVEEQIGFVSCIQGWEEIFLLVCWYLNCVRKNVSSLFFRDLNNTLHRKHNLYKPEQKQVGIYEILWKERIENEK